MVSGYLSVSPCWNCSTHTQWSAHSFQSTHGTLLTWTHATPCIQCRSPSLFIWQNYVCSNDQPSYSLTLLEEKQNSVNSSRMLLISQTIPCELTTYSVAFGAYVYFSTQWTIGHIPIWGSALCYLQNMKFVKQETIFFTDVSWLPSSMPNGRCPKNYATCTNWCYHWATKRKRSSSQLGWRPRKPWSQLRRPWRDFSGLKVFK